MKVTVVIVCFNEELNIGLCLDSLLDQTLSKEDYEILVVDNGSTDRTRQIVDRYIEKNRIIRLLTNEVLGISGSRNIGLRDARHDLVAFTDADCEAPRDWLLSMVSGYLRHRELDERVAGVGGANIPPEDTKRFYETLRIFLNTYWGSHGSIQGKRLKTETYVSHLPTVNALYNRHIILEAGGFDESFGNIGEDQDLSFRLKQQGYRFVNIPGSWVGHKLRPNYRLWAKNMFVYGKGRMWLLRKHRGMRREIVFYAPLALVLGLCLSFFFPLHPVLLIPLFYVPGVLVVSLKECLKMKKTGLILDLALLYAVSHISYGMGEIYGLWKGRPVSEKTEPGKS